MNTITLDNVPDALHRALQSRAAAHHRRIEEEAIECLRDAVGIHPGAVSKEEFERLKRQEREIREQILAEGGGLSSSENVPRDELYDRNALR